MTGTFKNKAYLYNFETKKLDASRRIIKLGSARSKDEAYAKRLRNVRDLGLKLDLQNLPPQLQNNRKMRQDGWLN